MDPLLRESNQSANNNDIDNHYQYVGDETECSEPAGLPIYQVPQGCVKKEAIETELCC